MEDSMDTAAVSADAQQDGAAPEAKPSTSLDPHSSSSLSDPATDPIGPADAQPAKPGSEAHVNAVRNGSVDNDPLAPATETVATTNPPGWDAAKEQVMKVVTTSENMPAPSPTGDAGSSKSGGRGGKRVSLEGGLQTNGATGDQAQATPGPGRPRGRGRGGGRPRGRGRGAGRGGKRKREDGSDAESTDSEVATPAVTMTKSGRNVQKPTSFVPPPQSPTATNKRKRTYKRNPESAVCRMCLRGTSPASNMIVFCDGCNTPYHRYCHQPPIDQAVIDEVDKEWYCKTCEKQRIVPVPEADVAHFVSAAGAPPEQRQKYFASLPPGMLVTLLTRATSLRPDLPVFGPDFEARASASTPASAKPQVPPPNNLPPQVQYSAPVTMAPQVVPRQYPPPMPPRPPVQQYFEDPRYPVPEEHPPHYVRPGQGLMRNLPPEQEDMRYLVDDDRHQVFSHYHIDPRAAQANAHQNAGQGDGGQQVAQMMGQGRGGMGMGGWTDMGQARPGA